MSASTRTIKPVNGTNSAVCTWRRTRNGEWVVVGPAWLIARAVADRRPVVVLSRYGRQQEVVIRSVGREFRDDKGVELAYGYLRARRTDGYCTTCHHRIDDCVDEACTCVDCGGDPDLMP